MNLESFVDELGKLASAGDFHLGDLVVGKRAPLNSVGMLVRRALTKRASDLSALHNEIAPTAIEVNPTDASTRSPEGAKAPSAIKPGHLGAVTPSADPIDRERFNRAWAQPVR
jgi:hypothetical protein